MKKLLVVPFCFAAVMTHAQKSNKFDFKLGTEYELPRKTAELAFVGNEKDGIATLGVREDELILIRFNGNSLDKTSEQKIDLEVTRNFSSEILADFSNGNYYWLYSDWDKSSEREMLFSDKVDISKGRIVEANTKLIETSKMAGTKGLMGTKTTNKYSYQYDAAHSKLLVSYRLFPESRKDKVNYDKIGFHVFDQNMKKLWSNEFVMPYSEAMMDNLGFSVDVDGNAYMLAKVTDDEAHKEAGKPNYHFEVLKFGKNSKEPVKIIISLDNYLIKQAIITENPKHDLVVACTYSKKGWETDGVFLATIDPGGKLVNYNKGYYSFPAEELKKFESAKSRRAIDKTETPGVENLVIRDIVFDSDGGVFVTLEQHHIDVTTYRDMNNRTSYQYNYYFGDILASKIDASGNFQWMRKIAKDQRGGGIGSLGFKLLSNDAGYYFLYIDDIKNLNLTEDETPKKYSSGHDGYIMVTKIAKDGTVSKDWVLDTKKEDIMITPVGFSTINGNQFLGRAGSRKGFQPIVITVKPGEVVSSK